MKCPKCLKTFIMENTIRMCKYCQRKAERPLDAAACSPGDIANGLLHAADDHPCCRGTLYAAANLLEAMKNTIHQREQAARLVRRLLRSHGEKSSRRSVAARSDAGLWLARYDQENAKDHPAAP